MKRRRSAGSKSLLDITQCVNCGADKKDKNDFPDYCPACFKYIQTHGRLPDAKHQQGALDEDLVERPGEDASDSTDYGLNNH